MVSLWKQIYSNILSGWFQHLSFILGAQSSTECTFHWNTRAQIVKYAAAMKVIETSLFLSLFTPHIKEKFHISNKKKKKFQ